MADYIAAQAVAVALGLDQTDDTTLATAVSSATTWVRNWCGRDFSATTSAATATVRYFQPTDCYVTTIDDCIEVTAVATDDGNNGTYSTSWSASDWQAQPVSGQSPFGQTGWPYTCVVAVLGRTFDTWTINRRPRVKVTAKWGWAATPDAVQQATLFLANEFYKAGREAPFGTANLADFGPVLIRGNRRVLELLQPYRTLSAGDGRFLVA